MILSNHQSLDCGVVQEHGCFCVHQSRARAKKEPDCVKPMTTLLTRSQIQSCGGSSSYIVFVLSGLRDSCDAPACKLYCCWSSSACLNAEAAEIFFEHKQDLG